MKIQYEGAMIAAIVLAAGLSRRMGVPKMVLPWKNTTVIGQVVDVLAQAGIIEIVVVTGGAHEQVEAALEGLRVKQVFNPRYSDNEMAYSVQAGLSALSDKAEATLVALGDQPQIECTVVQAILAAYQQNKSPLIVPSYKMHRGHPWLIVRSLWPEVQNLPPGRTLRDVLNAQADKIDYLQVDTPSILQDLDTPEDYRCSGYNRKV
jgi:molybdenum cofactor cytidylyltransferase